MKTEDKVVDRLMELGKQFREYSRTKKYYEAKRCYDKALLIACEMDMGEDIKRKMFGNRPYVDKEEEVVDGIFDEDTVLKVMEECIRNKETELQEEKKRRDYQLAARSRWAKK